MPCAGVGPADEGDAGTFEIVNNEVAGWIEKTVWVLKSIEGIRRLCKHNTTVRDGRMTKVVMPHDHVDESIV